MSDELSLKLERTITLSFRELASIDIAARAQGDGSPCYTPGLTLKRH